MVQEMKFDKYRTKGAYHYDWYDDPNYIWYKECVDRCVEFCRGSTLDVGGGDGLVAKKISENGYTVMVADNDKEAGSICWSKGIPFQELDLEKAVWATHDVTFDYLVSLNTIEHLRSATGYVNTINNNVRKGAIIITDQATEHKGRYHEKEYTLPELVEVFKQFKPKPFKIESTEHGKPITFIGVEIYK